MSETIVTVKSLSESIFDMIPTERVRVRKINGMINLIPIRETKKNNCPLLGLYAGGKLTLENHYTWSREDKILEGQKP
jgi:hypothetical protein